MTTGFRFVLLFPTLLVLPAVAAAQGSEAPLPLKYAGPPTVADITPGDLMTRLYKFADDSMMGRELGTPFNDMGTAYIESEVRRLGLKPAGDNGSFFQKLPLFSRRLDSASTVTVAGRTLHAGVDFVATGDGFARNVTEAQVIFVGPTLDTTHVIPEDRARGRVLVFTPGYLAPGTNVEAFVATPGYRAYSKMRRAAGVVVTVIGRQLSPAAIRAAFAGTGMAFLEDTVPVTLYATLDAVEAMVGVPVSEWQSGLEGKSVTTDVRFVDRSLPGRNVVAILPGADPKLRGEFVAIGAHNDHIGFDHQPVEHDSLKAFLQVVMPEGADSKERSPTASELPLIKSLRDSLRAIYPARPDSIYNGADDDGSGSMTVLEIAERFALGKEKPKRSILFVWHAGEEEGLWGSSWFTAHPTVPRDSIVAQLNMDMVGRGAASDETGEDKEGGLLHGGEGYVQLVGSRRLSTELGDLIEAVNIDKRLGLRFDYAVDANGHPQNIYCRSDHYEYAKYGIPVVFASTGGHADYHQVTDEPQYIQYPHMAQVARFIFESAMRIANLDHRLVVDQPKPDPKGTCVQ